MPAGGTASYTLDWDQKDDTGQQVSPGWYGVEVTVVSRGASDATDTLVRGVSKPDPRAAAGRRHGEDHRCLSVADGERTDFRAG